MSDQGLSLREFLADIRSILISPSRRFALIHERGALWGSVVLMLAPTYFSFTYMGSIYFDSSPFPGYAFLAPIVPAAWLILIKVGFIHFFARLLEGGGRYSRGRGTFRSLLTVLGYTMVPSLLCIMVALALFLLIPEPLGYLFRSFRTASIIVLVTIGVVFFVWGLILTVLAMRVVYAMRDFKIVLAFFIGSVLVAVPAILTVIPVAPSKVDAIYVRPILSWRFLRFLSADPTTPPSERSKVSVHVDRVVYRFKEPRRFELAAYELPRKNSEAESGGFFSRLSIEREGEAIGRIVGVPGDTVAVNLGRLSVNGQVWEEPYIPPEFRSQASVEPVRLGEDQYMILPEDRHLIETHRGSLVVDRRRITGRRQVTRWPLGWLEFRETAFLQPQPEGSGR